MSAAVAVGSVVLTPEERQRLAKLIFLHCVERQRYSATADPDPGERYHLRLRWQEIADAFDPEPWGAGERVRELAARAREAAEAAS